MGSSGMGGDDSGGGAVVQIPSLRVFFRRYFDLPVFQGFAGFNYETDFRSCEGQIVATPYGVITC